MFWTPITSSFSSIEPAFDTKKLVQRIGLCGNVPSTTIVSVEEYLRGWLAVLAKERQVTRQVKAYRELENLFDLFAGFEIISFNELAAARYEELRLSRIKVGTRELKIAAIVLVHDALLVTANHRDFTKVPGLRFENWLDP